MKFFFLFFYIFISAIHLYHSWMDNQKLRSYTKPFLLLFLILYYIFAASSINIFLLLALITSWLGDVLLIPRGHKWFALGGISFMFCHFFFMRTYFAQIDFTIVLWRIILPCAVLYYGIALAIIISVSKNTPKMMLAPMYFYMLCNSTMNIFALMQMIALKNLGAFTAFIGAQLFFISDCTLFLVRYQANKNLVCRRHFTVMLTYLTGEFLITQGMILVYHQP